MLPCLFCVSLLLMLWGVPAAWAATHYVSPSGSGTTCSSSTPCSLTTGISQGVAGDEVILKDGTYTTALNTVRDGTSDTARITFRAENRRQAIILGHRNFVSHSFTTVRGLVLDGNFVTAVLVLGDGHRTSSPTGLILEDNHLRRSRLPRGGFLSLSLCAGSVGTIVRHNLFEEADGESMYCGSNDASGAIKFPEQWQIYGNTYRLGFDTAIDMKSTLRNADVHHNIIENMGEGSFTPLGCTIMFGPTNSFHNNIVCNSDCGTSLIEQPDERWRHDRAQQRVLQ